MAKLTLVGLDIKTGLTKGDNRPYQLNNLKFEVMGKVRGTSTFVNITSGTTFDIQSGFCKALVNMGLKPQVLMDIHLQMFDEIEVTEDSEGFEVEDIPGDSDGFGVTDEREFDFSEIEKFCLLNCQKVFTGKVYQNDKKYWEIDPDSIKPLTKPKTEKETKSSKKETKSSKKTEGTGKNDPVTETITESETEDKPE